jgi:hypothetical protein
MKRTWIAAVAALLLTALGLGGLYLWQHRMRPVQVAEAPPAPASAAAPAPIASEPAIRHPLEAAPAASAVAPGDATPSWRQALIDVLGQSPVLRFVQTEDFSRRFVVTVDNLARGHAAPAMWPLNTTPGRFSVSGGDGELRNIAPENARRYTPLVQWLASVDACTRSCRRPTRKTATRGATSTTAWSR